MNRNMDGIYFRVERDGKWQNICFTDLTLDEIDEVIGERSAEWWKAVAVHLKDRINSIADELDLICEE